MIELDLQLQRSEFVLDAQAELPATGITAISGPSGCGKTTLLRCIAGLEPQAKGFIRIAGECWQNATRGIHRPPHQRDVGYVFQEARLFPHLTVKNNLAYAWKRLPREARTLQPATVTEWLGIEHLLSRRPHGLSGGEKQRVAIGRALLSRPSLLLMDEPLASLDSAGKREIMPYLERLHRELDIPVLYVSHTPDEIVRMADHLLWMDGGRSRASGPLGEMLGRLDLPLAHDTGSCALLEGRIKAQDEDFALTLIETPAGVITVPYHPAPEGTPVRLTIAARDVSLALQPAQASSILNILPMNVTAIAADNPSQVIVKLEANGAQLLSRITRKSCERLALGVGKEVFAQVKSVALVR